MLIDKSIIDIDFVPVKASDSVELGRSRMDQQNIGNLPIVNSTTHKLIGQISLEQLRKAKQDVAVSDLELDEAVKVYQGQHLFEAARLMLQYELSVLPVVDDEWTFLGVINKQKVLDALTKMLNLVEFGSVISVELSQMDFSISEVVQIIEVEEAKILGLTVEAPDEDNQAFRLSFKLNLQDISRITAALRRYGYTVFTESETEVFNEDLESRADELVKYMDM